MGATKQVDRLSFFLRPVPPFRLDLAVWTLRRRPDNALDRWDGRTYQRALTLGGSTVHVAVTQTGSLEAPKLRVVVQGALPGSNREQTVASAIERLLGLNADLRDFYRLASHDDKLSKLVERFRGMKPPRFPSVFECLVNAIACQQVSLTVGILLLNRLSASFGPATKTDPHMHAFPQPATLAAASPKELQELGFSRRKAEYIIDLSGATAAGTFDANELAHLANTQATARLIEMRGIGRWSAEYALLRGLGRWDVFPGDDVGAANNLKQWLGLRKLLDYRAIHRRLARWQPYAGLVYFHLLLRGLAQAGYIDERPEQH
jgi:DNA-3-methyladenine glycosylase II